MAAHDNLNRTQFNLDGLDGPLGSWGAPGQAMAGWAGSGMTDGARVLDSGDPVGSATIGQSVGV